MSLFGGFTKPFDRFCLAFLRSVFKSAQQTMIVNYAESELCFDMSLFADIKKALQEVNVDALSDNYPFDDHFKEKYGGTK